VIKGFILSTENQIDATWVWWMQNQTITLPKTLNKREMLEIPNILTRDG
jgi:hypothetical protein